MRVTTATSHLRRFLGAALLAGLANGPLTAQIETPREFNAQVHEAGVVEIKFREGYDIRFRRGAPTDLNAIALQSAPARAAMARVASGRWARVHGVSEARLDALRVRAEARSGRTLPDLNLYYRLGLPAGMSVDEAIALFRGLPEVEEIYPVPQAAPPPLPPDYSYPNEDNFDSTPAINRNVYQRYLDAAPSGIDARYAWTALGGTASGIKICDVEYDFNDDHADLPTVTRLGPSPATDIPQAWIDHGTAVMSELASLDNGFGTTGIATDADFYFASVKTTNGSGIEVAAAITRCADALDEGDVILIEQQTGGPNWPGGSVQEGLVPVEWIYSNYDAIVTAVAAGIIVVEAAANGGENLDDPIYSPFLGTGSHKPFLTANDSGAIIVGAANSPYTASARSRADFSCYGGTLDLQGWGDDIMTAGYGSYYNAEGEDLRYRRDFGGTSGASPMVTGAAAIASKVWQLAKAVPPTPSQIRALLRNTGTPQAGAGNIGPQPNLQAAILDIWGSTLPAAPVITPPGGTVAMPLQVSIGFGSGQNAGNTSLRYTLDGTDPTPDSYIFLPGDTIYLNYSATVKARSFVHDSTSGQTLAGAVATVTYNSSTPKVATPVITPNTGYLNQGQQLTITTSTPGSTIKYRTDGKSISFFYPGTTYTGPLTLDPGTYEITARAYKDGYYKSDLASSDEIVITPTVLPAPTIFPNGGTFVSGVDVYLDSTVQGGEVRYTLDGNTPSASSPVAAGPLVLESSATVKARLFLSGYTPSPTVSAAFTVQPGAAQPSFTPPSGGTATGSLNVSMSTTTPGGVIRYTDNGAEPASFSPVYSTPVTLGVGVHTVKAKTYLPDGTSSATTTASYTVYASAAGTVANPTMTPFSTQTFAEPFTVTMHTNTQGATIYYTMAKDAGLPADPTTASTPYTGPFTISANGAYYFKMRAFKTGLSPSSIIQSGQISKVTPLGTTQQPTISPPGGLYHNPVSVTLSAGQFETLIYTTNGTDPVGHPPILPPSAQYNSPINVNSGKTIRAIAYRNFFANGPIAQEIYTFQCAEPVIGPAAGSFTSSVDVSMSTITAGATIRYTTNGSEPTPSSTIYNAPFTLGVGNHTVKAKCYKSGYDPSATALAALVVTETTVPPAITTQPQSQTVVTGDPVSFDVTWTGSPSPSFQWRFNDVNIAGEIGPVLEIDAAQPGNSGAYTCVATNVAGQATSSPAVLTVVVSNDIFADGFESGDLSAWSAGTAPPGAELSEAPDHYRRTLSLASNALRSRLDGPTEVMVGFSREGEAIFRLDARPNPVGFEVRIAVRQAETAWLLSPWTELQAWEQPLVLEWTAASPGRAGGRMVLWGGETEVLSLHRWATSWPLDAVGWLQRFLVPMPETER